MNVSLLKKLSIGGGYGLALLCCLLAFPSYRAQTEETLSQTLDSVDRALNDPNAPAEIAIAAQPARHPFAGFLVRASVGFALLGTGGVVWSLFGKAEKPQPAAVPPFLLPPASNPSSSLPISPSLPHPLSQSPPHPVSPSPSLPTEPGNTQQRKLQLFQALANSPHAWILQLLEATPVLIWGEQQSGKTELAQIIALLRMVFLFHAVEVADPHGHINDWLPCFPVFGSDFDYDAIDARLVAYRERLKSSSHAKQPITTIWDEFTQYAENCTCQKTKEFDFIKSIIAESQKKDEFPIAISHGRTQTAKGGTTGTDEMFENGFIQIHLLAQRNATGRAMPSGRGFLKGLTKDANGKPEQIAIALPPWLRAATLYHHFPEINHPALSTLPERAPQSESLRDRPFPSPNAAPSPVPRYANLAQHLDNLMDSETIAPHLTAILKFALLGDEPVKARDIQRASSTTHPGLDADTIRLLRSLKADVIQSAFQELAALGKGHCRDEGSSLSFVPGRGA